MKTKTILYYTSNREKPQFEKKIKNNLIQNSLGLPIISVSQKPISLGKNICVGEVGHSYLNLFRQILIGAQEADSKYLVFAEADFLYPKEYFDFDPPGGNLYRYNNVWLVLNGMVRAYCRKKYSNGAQIAKRDFIIKVLKSYLKDQPKWVDGKYKPLDKKGNPKSDYNNAPFEYFGGKIASISFKTGNGMTSSASGMAGRENQKMYLPHWGNVDKLRKKYFV